MDTSGAWVVVIGAPDRTGILWPGLTLAGVLLVGALIVLAVDRWRKHAAKSDVTLSTSDQLASYRAMYEQGELSEDEFEQIRAHLGGELRRTARRQTASAPLMNRPVLPTRTEDQPSPNGFAPPEPPGESPSTGIRPE